MVFKVSENTDAMWLWFTWYKGVMNNVPISSKYFLLTPPENIKKIGMSLFFWNDCLLKIYAEGIRGIPTVASVTERHGCFPGNVPGNISGEPVLLLKELQRRIQDPVKHLRWSFL